MSFNVISIVGARPQFMKAAVVSDELRKRGFDEILVHTGQHYYYNMSDVFFDELKLPSPDYYLGVGSGSHGEQTGKMLIEIEKVMLRENPELVIVYGDTNSTLAGALAAAKLHIPVAHVEAGLRSFNKQMPEEINRVLTDHISDFLFAPTDAAVENLKNEGIIKGVHKVGDVMFDLALKVSNIVDDKEILNKFDIKSKEYALVTIHRAENTDIEENLRNIVDALNSLASTGIKIIFPIHPRTQKAVENYKIEFNNRIKVIPAVSYKEMIALEKNARVIITDSGGVQKEGYFFKVPCVIPRNETEWVELIDSGWNILSGHEPDNIVNSVLKNWDGYINMNRKWIPCYGDGNSSSKIVDVIKNYFG
jgi:UDP-GlcNAc3NAcA epimerase